MLDGAPKKPLSLSHDETMGGPGAQTIRRRDVMAWYDNGVLIYAMLVVFSLAWMFIPA